MYRELDEPGLTRAASDKAYKMAGLGPQDIDVAEVHDATSFCEVYQCEMLRFCPEGEGGKFIESGATGPGGKLPVNTSGGLVSKGHPVGATGLSMLAELATAAARRGGTAPGEGRRDRARRERRRRDRHGGGGGLGGDPAKGLKLNATSPASERGKPIKEQEMTIRFDNRVAIVTGAGNGLGRAHALLLASRGAKVVVNDPGGAVDGKGGGHAAADKVVDEIKAAGGQAVPNYDSVAEAKSAANIVKTAVDSFGTVDIVVNNAGVLRDKTFHNMTVEDFDFVVKVHFLGTAYVTHAAWPILRAKAYGRVVVTSSNSGIYGNFGQAELWRRQARGRGLHECAPARGPEVQHLGERAGAGRGHAHDREPDDAGGRWRSSSRSSSRRWWPICAASSASAPARSGARAPATSRASSIARRPACASTGRAPTVEDVMENIDRIADLSTNTVFRTSTEEVQAVVGG